MSHLVTIETKLRDPAAIFAACQRLGLPEPVRGSVTVYLTEATGLLLQLPDWSYPVVIDIESGNIIYDNFEGAWGDEQHLHKFLQIYAVEKARVEARKTGQVVTERALADGSIKLTIQVA